MDIIIISIIYIAFIKFTIRTPGTPDRWIQYEAELEYFWHKLQDIAIRRHKEEELTDSPTTNNDNSIDEKDEELNEIIDNCLSIFFYWVNFGPLSRGSAACGYVVLNSLLLSFQYEIESYPWMPSQIQLDWEAILRPSPKEFIKLVKPWMLPKLKKIKTSYKTTTSLGASDDSKEEGNSSNSKELLPKFNDVILTLRDAYTALNVKL